jgi:hypothetical protein
MKYWWNFSAANIPHFWCLHNDKQLEYRLTASVGWGKGSCVATVVIQATKLDPWYRISSSSRRRGEISKIDKRLTVWTGEGWKERAFEKGERKGLLVRAKGECWRGWKEKAFGEGERKGHGEMVKGEGLRGWKERAFGEGERRGVLEIGLWKGWNDRAVG